MPVKRGIYLAPFDELVEPKLLVELAQRAEAGGWDGFFLWDHIRYQAPVRAVSDPWIALSAIAGATDTLRIGPMVTPLSRRRVQKVARETVTLDHLSHGRLTLGVGLGSTRSGELAPFGEVEDARERARLLDDGLERLTRLGTASLSRVRCSSRVSRSGLRRAGPIAGRYVAPPAGTDCSRSSSPTPTPSRRSPTSSWRSVPTTPALSTL